jgi:hypothetical protein
MRNVNENPDEEPIAGIGDLACNRQPPVDLWPAIESAIRARRARAWRMPLWAGAALAASLVLTLGLSVLRGEHRGLSAPTSAKADVAQLIEAPVAAPDANPPLHPETRALLRANLKIVNDAEAQLKRALAQDPNGDYLKSLLASTRNQQMQLAALEDRQ